MTNNRQPGNNDDQRENHRISREQQEERERLQREHEETQRRLAEIREKKSFTT